MKHLESCIVWQGSHVLISMVGEQVSCFLWDKAGKVDEWGIWYWMRCGGDVFMKFICIAPWWP